PSTWMALLGNTTFTVALPAARYWHKRHQHSRMAMGSAVMRKRTLPHRQPPVITGLMPPCAMRRPTTAPQASRYRGGDIGNGAPLPIARDRECVPRWSDAIATGEYQGRHDDPPRPRACGTA